MFDFHREGVGFSEQKKENQFEIAALLYETKTFMLILRYSFTFSFIPMAFSLYP